MVGAALSIGGKLKTNKINSYNISNMVKTKVHSISKNIDYRH